MWLSKAAHFISIIASPAARVINGIAAVFLAMMMVLTGADVTLRYLFNWPIPGSWELTQFMMAIVVAFGLAYCALQKGHVRVELVVSKLPRLARVVMNNIASFAFLSLFILITWRTVPRALAWIDPMITTVVLSIPVFPFVMLVAAGCAVLCLVLLKDFFEDLYQAVKK